MPPAKAGTTFGPKDTLVRTTAQAMRPIGGDTPAPRDDPSAKWRKSYSSAPGLRVLHPGVDGDFEGKRCPTDHISFGRTVAVKGESFDSVADVVAQPGADSDFGLASTLAKEAIYRTSKREPIGRPYNRGHVQPDSTRAPGFRYGKPAMKADESVKYGMYPEQTEPEDKHKAMYVRTHGSWAPGEQITRGYNWKIDLMTATFSRASLPR